VYFPSGAVGPTAIKSDATREAERKALNKAGIF